MGGDLLDPHDQARLLLLGSAATLALTIAAILYRVAVVLA